MKGKETLTVNGDSLLTREEVATYLNVTERTVLDWAQREVIPAFKLAGSWRFRRQDIDTWLESQRSGPNLTTLKNDENRVHPKPFQSEEREQRIQSCISDIQATIQDTDRQVWVASSFQLDHGEDIANEAIARLIKSKKISRASQRINGEKISVITRRKV